MKFVLRIDCDGSAFDNSPGMEVAMILRRLAFGIERSPQLFVPSIGGGVFDSNDKDAGGWELSDGSEER